MAVWSCFFVHSQTMVCLCVGAAMVFLHTFGGGIGVFEFGKGIEDEYRKTD